MSDLETSAGNISLNYTTLYGLASTFYSANNNGTVSLTITPASNASGSDTVTITATDGGGLTATKSFSFTVSAVNDAPYFGPINAAGTLTDLPTTTIAVPVYDVDSAIGNVVVTTGFSSTYVQGVSVVGTGSVRAMTITPVTGQITPSPTTITLTATDNLGASSSTTFQLTISPNPTNPDGFQFALAAPGALGGGSGGCSTCGGGSEMIGPCEKPDLDQFKNARASLDATCNQTPNGISANDEIDATFSAPLGGSGNCEYEMSVNFDANLRVVPSGGTLDVASVFGASYNADRTGPLRVQSPSDPNPTTCQMTLIHTNGTTKLSGGCDSLLSFGISATGNHGGQWGVNNGYAQITDINVIRVIYHDSDACLDGCVYGSGVPLNGSVDMGFKLGKTGFGRHGARMKLFENTPCPALQTPARLNALLFGKEAECIFAAGTTNQLRQIRVPQGLVDISTIATNRYLAYFYSTNAIGNNGNKDVNGLYVTNGTPPLNLYDICNPVATNFNTLWVTENRGGLIVSNVYNYVPAAGGNPAEWQVTAGTGLRYERKQYATNGTTRTETHHVVNPANSQTIKKSQDTLQTLSFGDALTQRVLDPDTAQLTATYSYYTNVTDNGYGKLAQTIFANGGWQIAEYDTQKRIARVYSSFLNQAPTNNASLCRKIEYDYTTNVVSGSGDIGAYRTHLPRREIEYVLGQEVRRKYFVYLTCEKREIVCVAPGAAWNDSANLVTITKRVPSGFYKDELLYVKAPDGTLTTYTYSTNSTSQTTTVDTGKPDTTGTNVVDGTRSINIVGVAGQTLTNSVVDILSGITLSQDIYSNFDTQQRAQRVDHLDGTFETMSYGCCGLDSQTDRDGVTTSYAYDNLKRKISETRLGITMLYTYDGAGRVVKVVRQGTDATQVTLKQSAYDMAGRLIAETNAVGVVTTYSETIDGTGQTVKTTTFAAGTADAATRIETFAKDGSLVKVTGTAVNPVRYDYGVELEGGVQRAFTKEIKLDAGGSDTSESSKSYTDTAGRSYKTVFAAASGTPTITSVFTTLGQLTNTVDPDGVSTLFSYNLKGEPLYTCLDTNRNGSIDTNGLDRVTWTLNDVFYNSSLGFNVRRARTFTHPDANSTNILEVSRTEISTDGLRSWTTSFGLTNSSQTVYAGTTRTDTVTNPDNSTVVTVYKSNRLDSVTRKDSTGAQLLQTTYAYDAHGRPASVTDARNGTTTSAYDAADRVIATTSPPPGTGQSAQTITPFFDNLGHVVKLVQPDGSSLTNEYYATGFLKRTYGTRVYPVGYGYDAQGRITSMTNWTSFASNAGIRVTRWIYDAYRGFLASKRDDNNQGCDYTYTTAGRLLTRVWARGAPRITTTYGFDALGQMSSVTYSDGTPGPGYSYDRRGQKLQCVMNGTTTSYYYSSAGLFTGESYSGGTLGGLATTNLYDAYLRRSSVQLVGQSATINSYTYDNASRLSSVGDGTYSASYTRLANSELLDTVTFKQSITTRMTTTRQYDKLNRLLSINSALSAASALSYSYAYNDANQRISATLADGSYWIYQYDQLGQVVSGKRFWSDGTPVAGEQNEYAFDDIGNRTSAKMGGDSSGNNLRTATYTANNLNQYSSRTVPGGFDVIGLANTAASVTVNSVATDYRRGEFFQKFVSVNNASAAVWQSVSVATSGGGSATGNIFVAKSPESYTYDYDGNTTQDGRWVNTFDGENRLVRQVSATAVGPQQRLDFEYDCQGRRIRKKVWNNTAGTGTPTADLKFIYDGWNAIATLDGNNANALLKSFVWGLDLFGSLQGAGGVGGLIAMKPAGGAAHFAGYDGNGNVTVLVDGSSGTVSALYEYAPFGELIRMTGSQALANLFRFSTKYQDDETGFLYYGYRFYNPSTGRWPSRDPIHETGGMSLYQIVNNNTINRIDVLGLVLVGIDGTSSAADVHEKPGGYYNSHVLNFILDYKGVDKKFYIPGPNIMGTDLGTIVDNAFDKICKEVKRDPNQPIFLIGHSRGGAAAIEVANRLKKGGCGCKSVVNFLGLYDAVNRSTSFNTSRIPPNVLFTAHVRRDPAAGSRDGVDDGFDALGNPIPGHGGAHDRLNFSNTGTSGGQTYSEVFVFGTHSAMGGDPWGGDRPLALNEYLDSVASALADLWIRTTAISRGVPVTP
ncbi:MAG: hypothetical protein HY043_23180 [Verrucomicrobia bacterium]|nr:hypothetical protein [Verrucomicrobiota bacterium]